MKTVIIGGVAGGASAAARQRRLDEKAEIVMLERGGYVSFANCGLPYFIGGTISDKKKLTLQTPESFKERFNIDARINSEAVSINRNDKTVTVKNVLTGEKYDESYDTLILAPGAEPIVPEIVSSGTERVFTLRNIPDTMRITEFVKNKKPSTALIIGGGAIGLETAENLAEAGVSVTVAELSDHLVAWLDYDMAADIHSHVRINGIKTILGKAVRHISESGDTLKIDFDNGSIYADMAILSVGVRPETSLAKECGLELNKRGSITVDKNMRTSDSSIYAAGDAVEVRDFITGNAAFVPLAGPANKQGRIAADNICGINSVYTGTQGTSILKIFDMTAASTGLNEKAAAAAGIDYEKTYIYADSHASYYPGAEKLSIKILWDKDNLCILGAQAVGGSGTDKRIDIIAAAIRFGAKVTDLASLELAYAPPYGSAKDPVNMIGFVAENIINGKVKQFFWHDADSLPRDGSVTLLDVRTVTEYSRGNIGGFMNIPLDSLRERLDEIPKDKPVYVHCHSGLRSYIACRILSGNGYDCFNLAGGWRLYESVINEKKVPEYVCTECK